MIDYLKMLHLRKQGASVNAIAHAMTCKWDTVERVFSRCERVWGNIADIPENLSNEHIAEQIFIARYKTDEAYLQPDAEMIIERQRRGELRNNLWLEYVGKAEAQGKKAYKITRFNEIVSTHATKNDMSMRIGRQPGIEGQADWVGDKAHISERDTGERIAVHIFVLSLPYSGYFYAEAFRNEKMESWIDGHRHAFAFFGGCPSIMVPDNCRTAITRPQKGTDTPAIITTQYAEFADHYGFLIKPARVRRPKDKAHVERTVRIIEEDILTPLARHSYHSLQEFNRMLRRKLLSRLERPYSKRTGSRSEIFMAEERKMLLPLPACEYQSYTEKKAVVSRDTHIQFDCAYYSVPVRYIKETVIVRATAEHVYIHTQIPPKL
ncbi:MAG: IS21 family transposase [Sphaerochaeta sp.]|jgi:hypothetical protein|uniref:IS21 family transposase n=1 Tax=Sphaerochaeta sp. TaxID=1972642 RepID=UPI003D10767F